jgi:hypothetical protein
MFEILSTSCDGGDCPTFLIDRTTGTVRVRGYDATEPGRELEVDIPAVAWTTLLARLPR